MGLEGCSLGWGKPQFPPITLDVSHRATVLPPGLQGCTAVAATSCHRRTAKVREVVCDCPLASVFSSLGTWGRTSWLQVWLEGCPPQPAPWFSMQGSSWRGATGRFPGLEQGWGGGSRMALQACSHLPPTPYLSILLTLRAGPVHPHPFPCSHPSLPPPHLPLSHHLFIPAPHLSCPIASVPQAPSLYVCLCLSLLGVPLAPALAVLLSPTPSERLL